MQLYIEHQQLSYTQWLLYWYLVGIDMTTTCRHNNCGVLCLVPHFIKLQRHTVNSYSCCNVCVLTIPPAALPDAFLKTLRMFLRAHNTTFLSTATVYKLKGSLGEKTIRRPRSFLLPALTKRSLICWTWVRITHCTTSITEYGYIVPSFYVAFTYGRRDIIC